MIPALNTNHPLKFQGTWKAAEESTLEKALLKSAPARELARDLPSLPVMKDVDYRFTCSHQTVRLRRGQPYVDGTESLLIYESGQSDYPPQAIIRFTLTQGTKGKQDKWVPSRIDPGMEDKDRQAALAFFEKLQRRVR
jgi:hypothetical protein